VNEQCLSRLQTGNPVELKTEGGDATIQDLYARGRLTRVRFRANYYSCMNRTRKKHCKKHEHAPQTPARRRKHPAARTQSS
jgi:hypothetical protein